MGSLRHAINSGLEDVREGVKDTHTEFLNLAERQPFSSGLIMSVLHRLGLASTSYCYCTEFHLYSVDLLFGTTYFHILELESSVISYSQYRELGGRCHSRNERR